MNRNAAAVMFAGLIAACNADMADGDAPGWREGISPEELAALDDVPEILIDGPIVLPSGRLGTLPQGQPLTLQEDRDPLDEFVGRLAATAKAYTAPDRRRADAGAANEPAQEKLAYVFGAKDPNVRQLPKGPTACTERLHGLDCSGFVSAIFRGAGVDNVPEGARAQLGAANWNLSAFGLRMRDIGGGYGLDVLQSGDVFGWDDASGAHVGVVIRLEKGSVIAQSNGSQASPPCTPVGCSGSCVRDLRSCTEQCLKNRTGRRGPRTVTGQDFLRIFGPRPLRILRPGPLAADGGVTLDARDGLAPVETPDGVVPDAPDAPAVADLPIEAAPPTDGGTGGADGGAPVDMATPPDAPSDQSLPDAPMSDSPEPDAPPMDAAAPDALAEAGAPDAPTSDRPATCSDGMKNGDETDVDCGGTCAPCTGCQRCLSGRDCTTGYCGMGSKCSGKLTASVDWLANCNVPKTIATALPPGYYLVTALPSAGSSWDPPYSPPTTGWWYYINCANLGVTKVMSPPYTYYATATEAFANLIARSETVPFPGGDLVCTQADMLCSDNHGGVSFEIEYVCP